MCPERNYIIYNLIVMCVGRVDRAQVLEPRPLGPSPK